LQIPSGESVTTVGTNIYGWSTVRTGGLSSREADIEVESGTAGVVPGVEPEPEPARAVVAKKVAKKKVRFADEPVGAPVTRLHISAPHKITPKSTPATRDKGKGKTKSKSKSESKSGGGARIIERVETFEQDPAERDRSFVAGPHIGHGRRELRRRLELEKAEAEAAAAAAGAAAGVSAAATVSDGDDVATRAEEPEPQPEPEPQTQPEEEEPVAADEEQAADEEDLGPDGGGYE